MKEILKTIYEIIDTSETIDLLAKLSYLKWMTKTDIFSDISTNSINFYNAKNALYFVISYVFSHASKFKLQTKITYTKIVNLINEIDKFYVSSMLNNYIDDDLTNRLKYFQSDGGELLPCFYSVPFKCVLSCEDNLIKNKYNCTAEDILRDYINIFKFVQNPFRTNSITIKEFITNFDKYCDYKQLSFRSTAKSYNLLLTMSCSRGEISSDEFDPISPLSLIKKHRKILLKDNDLLYCFDMEMFPNLIIKCAERSLQEDNKQNHKWDENMKERTEELVKKAFLYYFKDGHYYRNLTFKNKHGKGESDGLFDFLDYLFVIEIKSAKVSPDPVVADNTTVHESYNKIISKAQNQCDKVENHIKNHDSVFMENNKEVSLHFKTKTIIKLVILFDDLSAVLPDEKTLEENHTIFLSYYDLLIIFDFINNPLLLLKYFLERTKKLSHLCHISDEIAYLGIFRDNIDIADQLNNQQLPEGVDKIDHCYLDLNSFMHDIEIYYTSAAKSKPKISLTKFQELVIKSFEKNTSTDMRKELSRLLLFFPKMYGDKLMNIYLENNDKFSYIPQACVVQFASKETFVIMVSKRHKGDERYTYYAAARRLFIKHENVSKIISLMDGKDAYAEIITRGQKELNYQKTIDALKDYETNLCFKERDHIELPLMK